MSVRLSSWTPLLAFGLMLQANGAVARPRLVSQDFRQGGWRLSVQRDLFSGGSSCRLAARDGRAFFLAGSVAFRFPRNWNVGTAIYRIDGEAPQAARDDLPELARLGAPVDSGTMENPSGGIVWIPYRKLARANSIFVEVSPSLPLGYFRLPGLESLLENAERQGCPLGSQWRR